MDTRLLSSGRSSSQESSQWNPSLLSIRDTLDPASPFLSVKIGQATFDAEGQEAATRYFSRTVHYPGGGSGVTIGRGYDMGQRSSVHVQRDLLAAGVPATYASAIARAAGLRGMRAERFVNAYKDQLPAISLQSQQRLFESVVTPEIINDIKRIFSKPDVVQRYGEARWEDTPSSIRDLVFDLRFRGDYTGATRRVLQPLIVAKDTEGVRAVMQDRAFWSSLGVPRDRIERRIALLVNM